MITSSKYGQTLDPAIRKIYNDAYKDIPEQWSQIFNVMESDRDREFTGQVSGLGLLSYVPQAGEIPVKDPVQGYETTYIHQKFGGVLQVSDEEFEDDLHNVMKNKAQDLANSMKKTMEGIAANVFNYGHVASGSTFVPGADGVQFFSTQHLYEKAGSGVYANTFNGNATYNGVSNPNQFNQLPLQVNDANGALKTGQYLLSLQKDEFGLPVMAMADTIVVSQKNVEVASSLLYNKVKPGATNDEMNMRSYDIPGVGQIKKIIVWQWLTNSNFWMIFDSKQHQMNMFWRRKPQLMGPYYDEFHETNTWKLSARFSFGWSSPRFTFASLGDGSTFIL